MTTAATSLVTSIIDGSYRRQIMPMDDLNVSEVEDGLVVYEPTLDTAHRLNSTAAIVFTLVDRPRSMTEIAEDIGELFGGAGIDHELVSQTVDDLIAKRLLGRIGRS